MRQRHPGPGDGRSGAKYKPVAEGAGQRASKGMRCGIVGTGSLARSAGHLFRFREGGGTGSERETSAGRSGEAGRVPASRAGCDSERKAPAPPAPPPRPRLGRSRRSLPRPPGPPGHSATPSSLGLLCIRVCCGSLSRSLVRTEMDVAVHVGARRELDRWDGWGMEWTVGRSVSHRRRIFAAADTAGCSVQFQGAAQKQLVTKRPHRAIKLIPVIKTRCKNSASDPRRLSCVGSGGGRGGRERTAGGAHGDDNGDVGGERRGGVKRAGHSLGRSAQKDRARRPQRAAPPRRPPERPHEHSGHPRQPRLRP